MEDIRVPAESEVINAMKLIKAYCMSRDDEDPNVDLCYGCPMNPNCEAIAADWKIPGET